jgi:peptidoglycan/LPS O-acetylase OafA/YrhL
MNLLTDNKKNNFDGVRIGLALIVVFSHLSALTQIADFRIFESIFDSNFAVKGFFAISGFLVTKSYLSSRSILQYAEKRFRRIYPAYTTAIILCFCIGAFATSLSFYDFVKSSQTLKYLASNLIFLNFLQPTLPYVFDSNLTQALNGALWTIKVEVMLYFCVPTLIYLFNRFGSTKIVFSVLFLSIFWVYFFTYSYSGSKGDEIARQFPGQLSYFCIGSFLAVNKKILDYVKWITLFSTLALFACSNPIAKLLIDPLAYSFIVIFLSIAAFRSLNFGKWGDISYGIYLYHFPIIQLIIFVGFFKINVWIGLLVTFISTIAAALLSWHLIEKRLLRRTSHYVLVAKS